MGAYAGSMGLIPLGLEWLKVGLDAGSADASAVGLARFSPSLRDVMVFGPVLIIVLGVMNALSQYWQTRLSIGVALNVLRDLQNDMFGAHLRQDLAQMHAHGSGQTVSTFTNDTLVLRESLKRGATAVRDVLAILVLLLTMLFYDWALFLVVALIYPIIGVPVAKIGAYLRRTSRAAQAQMGSVTSLIAEHVAGGEMIKTFGLEPLARARAGMAFDERLEFQRRMTYARALNEPFIFAAGSFAVAVVVLIVGWRISSGAIREEEFFGFIAALLLLSQPARSLGTLNAVLQEGFGAFERMVSIIDRTPTITSPATPSALGRVRGLVVVDDVHFAYDGGAGEEVRSALAGVSLKVEPGQMLALVGPSGGGKTTLLNLLPRLYDPRAGAISFDGVDIRRASLKELRAQLAVVSQSPTIFNLSARENIAFGNPNANNADIIRAATLAEANDFIAQLPQGYDTPLGEGGNSLSGGQRQRIALARAFLKDAPILLLDEATSALDAESEQKVQAAMARLMKNRTSIVIAHRLSTVQNADQIAVMDAGKIVERGTHDELMGVQGLYAKLVNIQLRKDLSTSDGNESA